MKAKHGFLGLIMTFSTLAVFVNAHAFESSLVAAWTFEEGSGGTTVDVTGKGHDGTIFGEPEWVEGKNGKGLKIMDATQYVRVKDADDLNFGDNDFTFTAWINIDNFEGASSKCILSKRSLQDRDGCTSLIWVVGDEANELELQMRDDESEIKDLTANKTQLEAKKWYHVAVVKDIEDVTFYVNGIEDAKLAHGFKGGFTSYQPLFMGVHHWGIFEPIIWNYSLTGVIDEVGIFNKALTGAEIRTLMPSMSDVIAVEALGKLATSWGNMK